MKKIVNITAWVIFITGTLVLFSFTEGTKNKGLCKKIEIKIDWESGNQFITDDDVKTMINRMGYIENKTAFEKINSNQIETKLLDLSSTKSAKVYKDMNGVLRVNIIQRQPILRIINKNGSSFYLDVEGKTMSLSTKYTARVVVVNGELQEKMNHSVEEIKANDSLTKASFLDELYDFVTVYKKDEFFEAQFEQIFMSNKGELEVIPKVGNQKIIFGKPIELQEKLDRLKTFYTEGINPENLNLYTSINLKFNGQIVCTKK